jgi:hypothetical protein
MGLEERDLRAASGQPCIAAVTRWYKRCEEPHGFCDGVSPFVDGTWTLRRLVNHPAGPARNGCCCDDSGALAARLEADRQDAGGAAPRAAGFWIVSRDGRLVLGLHRLPPRIVTSRDVWPFRDSCLMAGDLSRSTVIVSVTLAHLQLVRSTWFRQSA